MTPLGPAEPGPSTRRLPAAIAVIAAGAVALALRSSLATVVVGVVLLGVLHAILELRYVAGRFSGLALGLGRPFLRLLALLVAGAVCSRLLVGVVGRPAQLLEIVLGYAIVALAATRVLDRRHRVPAWTTIAVAGVLSLAFPAHHFVVLAHLHLLAVVAFLWEWSRRLPSRRARRSFRAVQLGWAVVAPALILVGAADSWLGTDSAAVRSLVGDGRSVIAHIVPPGEVGTTLGARFLAVYALLQTMHLLAWVVFFPRWAPDAAADLEERLPSFTGARIWAAAFLGASLLAVVFVTQYDAAALLHEAVTVPHVYVEVPLLLALVARQRGQANSSTPASTPPSVTAAVAARVTALAAAATTVSDADPDLGPARAPAPPGETASENLLAHTVSPTYGRGTSMGRR